MRLNLNVPAIPKPTGLSPMYEQHCYSVYLQPLLEKHIAGEGITYEDLESSWGRLQSYYRTTASDNVSMNIVNSTDPSLVKLRVSLKKVIWIGMVKRWMCDCNLTFFCFFIKIRWLSVVCCLLSTTCECNTNKYIVYIYEIIG